MSAAGEGKAPPSSLPLLPQAGEGNSQLETRDAARRRAAMARIEVLHDRYLNPSERVARGRNRPRLH